MTTDIERAMPIFDTLRPPGPREDGFVHAGPVGAGHFAKMVHNGIEYALMTAYAEGYEMLAAEELVKDPQAVYQAWTNGTVVRSWLQQLLAKALKEDPGLNDISGYTEDSGEGRWTVEEAIRLRVPVPSIAAALFAQVPVPTGRFADDEGCRGTAEPVRRARRQESQRVRVTGVYRCTYATSGLTDFRSWQRVELDLEAGPHGVRRPERVREDESH